MSSFQTIKPVNISQKNHTDSIIEDVRDPTLFKLY